jgi:fatty acid desaturase
LFQPLYNILLMAAFEWGVALHDLDFEAIRNGTKDKKQLRDELKAIGKKARWQITKDYISYPALSAAVAAAGAKLRKRDLRTTTQAGFKSTLLADAIANVVRNVWSHAIIFCGHFPDQTYTFTQEEVENETRGGWYVRQLLGAANIDGSPLFHIISGNLGYQVEHHLYPDMPSSRYSEIAPQVKDICERYELPYNSGRFSKQWGTVHRSIFRLAFPGGKPRPKPGPYHGNVHRPDPERQSEGTRFRDRVPPEHPAAGPEHDSSGVEVQPPPRGKD